LKWYWYEFVSKIGSFTDQKSYLVALEKLIDVIKDSYEIVADVNTFGDPENYYERRTSTDSWGFDIRTYIDKQWDSSNDIIYMQKRYGANEDPNLKVKSDVRVALLPFEKDFYNQSMRDFESKFVKVDLLVDFLQTYCQGEHVKYYTRPVNFMEKYEKVIWERQDPKYLKRLIKMIPVLRDHIFKRINGLINSTILTRNVKVITLHTEVSMLLQLDVMKFSENNLIPGAILRNEPTECLKGYLTTLLFSQYCRVDYPIGSLATFDPVVLCDIILIRLLFPRHILTQKNIVAMNNYLFIHLFCAFKNTRETPSQILANYGPDDPYDDYGSRFLDTYNGDGRHELCEFFHTQRNSEKGFSSYPAQVIPYRNKFASFFLNGFLCELPYGVNDPNRYYYQLSNFVKIVELFNSDEFFKKRNKLGVAVKILTRISERAPYINDLAKMLNEAVMRLSAYPFCLSTMSKAEEKLENMISKMEHPERYIVNVKRTQLVAYAMMMNSTGVDVMPLPYEYIEETGNARRWAAELSKRAKYFMDTYTDRRLFKKEDVLAMILSGKKFNAPFESEFQKYVTEVGYVDAILPWEGENSMITDRKRFYDHIMANKQFYGFVNRFYFMKQPIIKKKYDSISKIWVYNSDVKVDYVLDREKIVEKILERSMNDFLAECYDGNKVIEFRLPVALIKEEVGALYDFKNNIPFLMNLYKDLQFGHITFYYQLERTVKDLKKPIGLQLPVSPLLVIHEEDIPFISIIKKDIFELPSNLPAFTSSLRLLGEKDFIDKKYIM